jgi:hypothetical protein
MQLRAAAQCLPHRPCQQDPLLALRSLRQSEARRRRKRTLGNQPLAEMDVAPVGALTKGTARIMATEAKGVVCSAYLADSVSPIPSGMVALTIAKKTKQKGD